MPGDQPVLYEMMYIIDPDIGEDRVQKSMEQIKREIQDLGGTFDKETSWGQRRLAYPIKKRTEGFYVVLEYRLSPSKNNELQRLIRLSPEILRHLSLKVPKAKLVQDEHDARMLKKRAEEARKAREEAGIEESSEATRSESHDREAKPEQEDTQSSSPPLEASTSVDSDTSADQSPPEASTDSVTESAERPPEASAVEAESSEASGATDESSDSEPSAAAPMEVISEPPEGENKEAAPVE